VIPAPSSPTRRWTRHKPGQAAHGTCKLTLTIGGTDYALLRIPCDAADATALFRLRKRDPGAATYYVSASPDGRVDCSCADFLFRHSQPGDAGCKHVRALRATGLLRP
jgi:hypothetical protein